jgi:hypothetical protein
MFDEYYIHKDLDLNCALPNGMVFDKFNNVTKHPLQIILQQEGVLFHIFKHTDLQNTFPHWSVSWTPTPFFD